MWKIFCGDCMPITINDPLCGSTFDNVSSLGVALKGDGKQQHVAILVKVGDGPAMICHFGWHNDVRYETADNRYIWLESGLHPSVSSAIASAVAGMMELGRPIIGFSPIYEGVYFDENLNYLRGDPGDGLTCSTFVISIFEALHVTLLDTETWGSRSGDDEWQYSVVQALEEPSFTPDPERSRHAKALRQRLPFRMRFRPEEVAIGVAASCRPVSYNHAALEGNHLVSYLSRRTPILHILGVVAEGLHGVIHLNEPAHFQQGLDEGV